MNKKINQVIIKRNLKIKDVLKKLQSNRCKILCLVSNNNKLIGVINDGDIRRGFIKNLSLDDNIEKIVNKKPITLQLKNINQVKIQNLFELGIDAIPILQGKKLVDIIIRNNLSNYNKNNTDIIINAGGKGKRLKPYTNKTHKMLVKVKGKKVIGDYILDRFIKQNFVKFTIIINNKYSLIKSYLRKKYRDIEFKYIKENKFLGTCGGLSLINKNELSKNCLLINCDIITNINFINLINFHKEHNADLTIVVAKKKIDLPYGKINFKEFKFNEIIEKPEIYFSVNAGIYIFKKELIKYLRRNKKTEMNEFIEKLKNNKKNIKIYPIHEYWLDVGTPLKLKEFQKYLNDK